jgi:hypothetical protein
VEASEPEIIRRIAVAAARQRRALEVQHRALTDAEKGREPGGRDFAGMICCCHAVESSSCAGDSEKVLRRAGNFLGPEREVRVSYSARIALR